MEKNEQKIEVGDVVRLKSDQMYHYTVGELWGQEYRCARIYGHNTDGILVTYEVEAGVLEKVR